MKPLLSKEKRMKEVNWALTNVSWADDQNNEILQRDETWHNSYCGVVCGSPQRPEALYRS